jgi:glycosyltransferase involved in cell wall biosynthesis
MSIHSDYSVDSISKPLPPFQSGRACIFNQAYGVTLSIVVPLYNEADNIDFFLDRTERVLQDLIDPLGGSYEFIFINDGSSDDTVEKLLQHRDRNPQIKIISLSRNFGKESAMSAGLHYATGAAVVPMDVDLQDPPEILPDLFEKWLEGYDVIYAIRRDRHADPWMKRLTAFGFFRLFNQVAETKIPKDTGDFRLMDRRVIQALVELPERTRFMKGLFTWVGFRQIGVEYDRHPRASGNTKWNNRRLWKLAMDGITSFSIVPLRVWTYIGLMISFLALSYGAFLTIRTVVEGIDVPGYASLMVTMLFLGGLNLFTLGVLGEYLGRVFMEVKGRPLYLLRETYGIEHTVQKHMK